MTHWANFALRTDNVLRFSAIRLRSGSPGCRSVERQSCEYAPASASHLLNPGLRQRIANQSVRCCPPLPLAYGALPPAGSAVDRLAPTASGVNRASGRQTAARRGYLRTTPIGLCARPSPVQHGRNRPSLLNEPLHLPTSARFSSAGSPACPDQYD